MEQHNQKYSNLSLEKLFSMAENFSNLFKDDQELLVDELNKRGYSLKDEDKVSPNELIIDKKTFLNQNKTRRINVYYKIYSLFFLVLVTGLGTCSVASTMTGNNGFEGLIPGIIGMGLTALAIGGLIITLIINLFKRYK